MKKKTVEPQVPPVLPDLSRAGVVKLINSVYDEHDKRIQQSSIDNDAVKVSLKLEQKVNESYRDSLQEKEGQLGLLYKMLFASIFINIAFIISVIVIIFNR